MIQTAASTMKTLIPAGGRKLLREGFDRLFCDSSVHLSALGDLCQWHVTALPFLGEHGTDWNGPIISGGAGGDISFEIACIAQFRRDVYLYDPSDLGAETVAKHLPNENLKFKKQAISRRRDHVKCFPNHDEHGNVWYSEVEVEGRSVAQSIPSVSLADEIRRMGSPSIPLLKLDIEGFEYEVLDEIMAAGVRVAQICVEYHHFFEHIPLSRTIKSVRLLQSRGFRLCRKARFDFTFVHDSLRVGSSR